MFDEFLQWEQQPGAIYGINRGHPLANRLLFCGLPVLKYGVVDLVTGIIASPTGSGCNLTYEANNGGTARQQDAGVLCANNTSSGAWRWPAAATGLDLVNVSGAYTLVAMAMPKAAASIQNIIGTANDAAGDGFGMGTDDNVSWGPGRILRWKYSAFGRSDSTDGTNNALTAAPTNKLHFFGNAWSGSNQFGYYQNLFRAGTTTGTPGGTGAPRRTGFGTGIGNFTAVSVALGMAFSGVIEQADYVLLARNPWAMFRYPSPAIYSFASAAAGVAKIIPERIYPTPLTNVGSGLGAQ